MSSIFSLWLLHAPSPPPFGAKMTASPTVQNEIPSGYEVQDLPQRYLKSRVLEEYIKARPDEFGDSPKFEVRQSIA